jgi:16S rRNA (adenine1518-N6/adenine1519-N6)-dimethyltransferase
MPGSMIWLPIMTSPSTLLKARGIHPKKQLGQNFLSDPSTAKMIIARAQISQTDIALEIGAGLGAITVPLSQAAATVYAVEKDTQLVDILKTELFIHGANNVIVVHGNILNLDIPSISRKAGDRMVVFGNLPYNISSQILVQLILSRQFISRCFLMFQKELAERLIAEPGSKDYGRLSVMLRFVATVKPLATIKANLFYPKPKVDSEIIEINFTRPSNLNVLDESFFYKVIKAAFLKRRKTLKNSLSKSILEIKDESIASALAEASIDGSRRAETLTTEEFARLSNILFSKRDDK